MEIENLKLQKQIDELIDKIYPIGSYYETSNPDFNPNDEWGGVWIQDTKGLVTVGALIDSQGEADITTGSGQGIRVTLNNKTGDSRYTIDYRELPKDVMFNGVPTPNPSYGEYLKLQDEIGATGFYITNPAYYGQTKVVEPPSIGVNRWHRTA